MSRVLFAVCFAATAVGSIVEPAPEPQRPAAALSVPRREVLTYSRRFPPPARPGGEIRATTC